MRGFGGDQEEVPFIEKIGRYKTGVKRGIGERERLALRNNVKDATKKEIYRGLNEDIRKRTYTAE